MKACAIGNTLRRPQFVRLQGASPPFEADCQVLVTQGAIGEGGRYRTGLPPGDRRLIGQPYVQRAYGLGRPSDHQADYQTRSAGGDQGEHRGHLEPITRSAAFICLPGGSLAEFDPAFPLTPNFSLVKDYYGLVLIYWGRWGKVDQAILQALRLNPRSILGDLYRHCRLRKVCRTQPRGGDAAAREAIRQREDYVGDDQVITAASGMAGQAATAEAALQELRRAQTDISHRDRDRNAHHAGSPIEALFGSLPSRRVGPTWASTRSP